MAKWRRLARYSGTSYYTDEWYCGGCGYHVDEPYTFPSHIDDHDREDWYQFGKRELWYFRFCPWCGASMDAEHPELERQLPPDHMNDPGYHAGDEHHFLGDPSGHYLAGTGDTKCWCDPEIERSLFKCVIRHKNTKPPSGLRAS